MTGLGFHLVFRLKDDRVIAPDAGERRRLAQVFARLSRDLPILAWRVVDTHVHVLGRFDAAQVVELTRRLRICFAGPRSPHRGVPLRLASETPIRNQWHLAEAFPYVLRQDQHHAVLGDPYQEGSAVCDLLGLRAIGAVLASRVREQLPRVRREDLLPHLGVVTLAEAADLEHLAEATCAAFALPDLRGNDHAVVLARAAAIHAAEGAHPAEVGAALGLGTRAVYRLREREVPAAAVRAVRLGVGLRVARPVEVSANEL